MNYRINFPWCVSLRMLRFVALLAALVLSTGESFAWRVYNFSSSPVRARVLEGDWNVVISPDTSSACDWENGGCNPSGKRDKVVTLQIETLDDDPVDFEARVRMEAGGVGIVSERQRPSRWFAPPNLYVLGQSVSGQKIDQEPYGVDASSRGVHFFVTADTHFGNIEPDNPPPGPSPNEQDVIEEMHLRLSQDPSIRGICLAGDLVDYVTRYTLGIPLEDYTALNLYNASMGSWSRFHYDGVGEGHDYNELHFQVVDEVANRKHSTAKTFNMSPHYAWDWHDVHFIQLNNRRTSFCTPPWSDRYVCASVFLEADLTLRVGPNSQRPVVIFAHVLPIAGTYGLDVTAQRDLWNAISAYNVIAIFGGHQHVSPNETPTSRFFQWERPAGATGGPDFIPVINSGSGTRGAYVEVQINNANQFRVQVHEARFGPRASTDFTFNTPVWVDQALPAPGYGWKDDPYPTVGEAINATSNRFPGLTNVVEVRIKPGDYNEVNVVRIDQPTRLVADGSGTVHIRRP